MKLQAPAASHFLLFIAGYMISAAAANVTLALSLAPPFLIPLMLFGGFFLNAE
jgi:hypothetical protein